MRTVVTLSPYTFRTLNDIATTNRYQHTIYILLLAFSIQNYIINVNYHLLRQLWINNTNRFFCN